MGYATITAKEVLDAIVASNGFDPDHYTPTAKELAQFSLLANHAIRKAWEAELWPQLMVIEQRRYRPDYDATVSYSTDKEVWYGAGYWRSLSDANQGNTPATGSAYWESADADMIAYIAFDQPWETRVIDETGVEWARCVFAQDPQLAPDTPPLDGCRPFEQSILVPTATAPLEPYVRFRPTRPKVSFVAYTADTAYAAGDVRYRSTTGHCYLALLPSTAKTPEDEVTYWSPVGIPEMFEDFIRLYLASERATDDEGKFKSLAKAEAELDRLRDVYLHIGGDRTATRMRWRSSR
jgi:hypothetical protein